MEQGYLYDVYSQIGNIAGQGAFSSGGINEGYWQTSMGGGWGSDDATSDNQDFCIDHCANSNHYDICFADCITQGP